MDVSTRIAIIFLVIILFSIVIYVLSEKIDGLSKQLSKVQSLTTGYHKAVLKQIAEAKKHPHVGHTSWKTQKRDKRGRFK